MGITFVGRFLCRWNTSLLLLLGFTHLLGKCPPLHQTFVRLDTLDSTAIEGETGARLRLVTFV